MAADEEPEEAIASGCEGCFVAASALCMTHQEHGSGSAGEVAASDSCSAAWYALGAEFELGAAGACGDVMKLQIRVGEDGRVQDAVFKVRVKPRCGRFIAAPPSLPFFRFAAGRSRFRVRVSSFPLRGPRPRRHAS